MVDIPLTLNLINATGEGFSFLWDNQSSLEDQDGNNGNFNSSDLEIPLHYTKMSKNAIISAIAYSFVFVIAATGNFCVFFSILQQLKRTKSRISVLILHLSIADLLVTFGVIPLEIVWRITIQWYGGNILCKVCKLFSAFGLYLSSTVLICISLDRYFAIIHPLRSTDANRRGRIMLTLAWVSAAVFSAPQGVIFYVEHHPLYPTVHQCVSILYFSKDVELIYNVFSVSIMYFVPLFVIGFTYGMILCKISRKSRQEGESRNNDNRETGGKILLRRSDTSNRMERAKSRTLRLTFVIVVVFVLCWTPYVVMTLWYMFDRESAEKVDGLVQDALFIMAVANSCVNPLVYGTFTKECRHSMTNCCGCLGSDPQETDNNRLKYSASLRSALNTRMKQNGGIGLEDNFNSQGSFRMVNSTTLPSVMNQRAGQFSHPINKRILMPSSSTNSIDVRKAQNIIINLPRQSPKMVHNDLATERPFQEINEFYSKSKPNPNNVLQNQCTCTHNT